MPDAPRTHNSDTTEQLTRRLDALLAPDSDGRGRCVGRDAQLKDSGPRMRLCSTACRSRNWRRRQHPHQHRDAASSTRQLPTPHPDASRLPTVDTWLSRTTDPDTAAVGRQNHPINRSGRDRPSTHELGSRDALEPVRCGTTRPRSEIHRPGARLPSDPQGLLGEECCDSLTSRRSVDNHVFDAAPQVPRRLPG